MAKTLEELFQGNPDLGNKNPKDNPSTFLEQELNGIRTKSGVDLNNPVYYGADATRIGTRSTNTIEIMYAGRNAELNDGGLIGKGIGEITKNLKGGQLTSISQVRNKIGDFLGIPQPLIPTTLVNKMSTGASAQSIIDGKNGTEFGKLLQQSAKGKPKDLIKQSLGGAINFGKDKLRSTLFGDSNSTLPGNGSEDGFNGIYTDTHTYSIHLAEPANDPFKEIGSKEEFEQTTQNRFAHVKQVDISSVSPVYGVQRGSAIASSDLGNKIKEQFGASQKTVKPPTSDGLSKYDPQNPYTGKSGEQNDLVDNSLENRYGLTSEIDELNVLSPTSANNGKSTEDLEKLDLIPFWMGRKGLKNKIHFRTLLTGINETVSPEWNSNKFFGNPFSFYTYGGVERSVTFSLQIYCSNQTELLKNWEKVNELTVLTYPHLVPVDENGKMVNPPIIDFKLGDIYNKKIGYIDSLSYTFPENGTWETDPTVGLLPKFIEVSVSIKFIEQTGDNLSKLYDYTPSEKAIKAWKEESGTDTYNGNSVNDNVISTSVKPDAPVKFTQPKGIDGNPVSAPKSTSNPVLGESKIPATGTTDSEGLTSIDFGTTFNK